MGVRPYAGSDFGAVCGIYAEAKCAELQFEDRSFPITPLENDPVLLAAFEESTVFVFESENHAVVGFVALHGTQLRALFVRTDARGMGAGTALLRSALGHAPALELNVAKSNAPARRFYERHGFLVAGASVRQYGGGEIDYVRMASAPADTGIRPPGGPQ